MDARLDKLCERFVGLAGDLGADRVPFEVLTKQVEEVDRVFQQLRAAWQVQRRDILSEAATTYAEQLGPALRKGYDREYGPWSDVAWACRHSTEHQPGRRRRSLSADTSQLLVDLRVGADLPLATIATCMATAESTVLNYVERFDREVVAAVVRQAVAASLPADWTVFSEYKYVTGKDEYGPSMQRYADLVLTRSSGTPAIIGMEIQLLPDRVLQGAPREIVTLTGSVPLIIVVAYTDRREIRYFPVREDPIFSTTTRELARTGRDSGYIKVLDAVAAVERRSNDESSQS